MQTKEEEGRARIAREETRTLDVSVRLQERDARQRAPSLVVEPTPEVVVPDVVISDAVSLPVLVPQADAAPPDATEPAGQVRTIVHGI